MAKNINNVIIPFFCALAVGFFVFFDNLKKTKKKRQNDFYLSVLQFEKGNYRKALYGDDTFIGFFNFISDNNLYKNDDIELAKLYAGISLIKTKDYLNGIDYLKDLNFSEPLMIARINGFIGESYIELGNYDKAIEFLQKAANSCQNDVDPPIFIKKIILCYEKIGKYKEVLDLIDQTLKKYPLMEVYDDFVNEKKKIENILH